MPSQESKDDSLVEVWVKPSLIFGAVGGTFGLLLGTITGTLRSKTPALFATVSGLQCFALGSTYWALRIAFLQSKSFHPSTTSDATPSTYINASTAAGGLTGSSLGLLLRGPRNAIPGAVMFALFGYSGQHIYNAVDARHSQSLKLAHERSQREIKGAGAASEEERHTMWRRFVEWVADPKRKWSPIRQLSDKEYEEMLTERLIAVEADLAMVEEEIERVQKEKIEGSQEKGGKER